MGGGSGGVAFVSMEDLDGFEGFWREVLEGFRESLEGIGRGGLVRPVVSCARTLSLVLARHSFQGFAKA